MTTSAAANNDDTNHNASAFLLIQQQQLCYVEVCIEVYIYLYQDVTHSIHVRQSDQRTTTLCVLSALI